MDWTGEHLIRSAGRNLSKQRIRDAQRAGSGRRVPDERYAEASGLGLTVTAAAAHLGVSTVSIWKAAKRLGLKFRDGRRNG